MRPRGGGDLPSPRRGEGAGDPVIAGVEGAGEGEVWMMARLENGSKRWKRESGASASAYTTLVVKVVQQGRVTAEYCRLTVLSGEVGVN